MKTFSFLVIIFLMLSNHAVYARKIQSKDNSRIKSAIVPYKEKFIQDGVSFILKSAEVVFLDNQDYVADPASTEPDFLVALRYEVSNRNQTKKMDIDKPFNFVLGDEFKNTYRSLVKPVEYLEPVTVREASFPSLYPDQSFEEVLFFEAPIAESKTLFLTVDAANVGINKKFMVSIPVEDISGMAELTSAKNAPVVEEAEAIPVPLGPLEIVLPVNGANVSPGESIQLKVVLPENALKPNRVYVVLPSYVLEDQQLTLEYDVRIPEDSKGSFPITVIGKWDTEQGEEVLSDSIVLSISAPALVNN